MNDSFFVLVSVALAIGAVVWRFRAWQKEQRAREELVAFALSKGWDFLPPDASLVSRWPGDPFRGGTDPRCGTVIRGTVRGRGFTAFEYIHDKVTTDSRGRRHRQTYRFTVCVLELPGYLPVVQVVPESIADRAMSAVGWSRDQEFESEDFNRAFRVETQHPKDASDLLPPRTLQMLVARPAFAWRTQGTDLVTWVPGIIDSMGLLARLDTMSSIVDGVPTFVWHDRGAGGGIGSTPVTPAPETPSRFSWEA